MANTLRFKRGLVSGIPTAALGEPLFTTDTFDLYIGNGTGNTRFQKYIASGTTSQLLRGDGSLLTMPIVLTSPSSGQVLKYDGTNWVNSADAGVTGSGAAGQVTFWGSSSTVTGSNDLFWNSTNGYLGIGTNTPSERLHVVTSAISTAIFSHTGANGAIDVRNTGTLAANRTSQVRLSNGTTFFGANDRTWQIINLGTSATASVYTLQYFDGTNYTRPFTITDTGRLLLGSTSDNGLRFQVTGDGFFSGSVGIGSTSITQYGLRISKNITGSTSSFGAGVTSTIQSDVTVGAYGYYTSLGTAAASFTLSNLIHFQAAAAAFGAGSSVTSQYGFAAGANLTGATNNYGFYGDIASGTGRWNLYMNGSAQNYLNGGLAIAGTTLNANALLQINANANDNRVAVISNTNTGTAAQAAIQLTSNAGTASFNVYSSSFGITEFASTALLSSGLMANGLLLNTSTTAPIVFRTNGSERMRLVSDGYLGIGTTTPLAPLQVNTSNSASFLRAVKLGAGSTTDGSGTYIEFPSSTTDNLGSRIGGIREGAGGKSAMVFYITNTSSVVAEQMRLNGDGNLGLGITPSAWRSNERAFQIGTVGSISQVSGAMKMSSNSVYLTGTPTYITSNFATLYSQNIGEHQWYTAPSGTAGANITFTQAMTLFATGNLAVGTTTDAGFRLDVNGTMRVSGASTFSSSVTATGNITSSDGTSSTIVQTATNAPRIVLIDGRASGRRFDLGSLQTGAGTFSITDATAGLARFTIAGDGTAIFSGNVGIGGTGASYKLDVTGEARVSNAIAIGTTPDTNKPFKILKNINGTVGINFENTSTGASAFSAIQMGTDVSGGTKFTNLVYASSGVTASGVYNPDGTSLINNGSGGLNFLGTPIRFYTGGSNGVLRYLFDNEGAIQYTTTAPTTNAVDGYKQYSADVTAGNAAPHFRTENGAVIKLYQETTGVGNAIFSQGGGNSVLDDSTFDGYTLRQIVKALRNQGILA